jgi:hypothetical protein
MSRELLKETHFKDGTILMPEAVEGCIKMAIDEVKEPIAQIEHVKKIYKTSGSKEIIKDLKKRFPSLRENITDEECMMIDTYDKLFDQYDKAKKTENSAHLDMAKTRFSKLGNEKKEKIKQNALKAYKELPSEDKTKLTEDQFIISHYASTLPKREPIIEFCNPKGTFEDERQAMKEMQEIVGDLLSKNNKDGARTMARLFFGNFGEKYFDIEKGRNWSDKEIEEWISWIIKQQMPEQLKASLVELMEDNLKIGKSLKDYRHECQDLFKSHNYKFALGELTKLHTHVKETLAEHNESEPVFKQVPIKTTNPELWAKAEDISSPSGLYNFLKEHELDWKDALNLAFDILSTLPQGETGRTWNNVEIEDWFDKYIENKEPLVDAETDIKTNKVEEIQTAKDVIASPVVEIKDIDFTPIEKANSKSKLQQAIKTIITKSGVKEIKSIQNKKVLSAIVHNIQNIQKGYGKTFANQPLTEIYPFVLKTCRQLGLIPKKGPVLPTPG